jgi:predicted lipoprotein with Yx(FWY)xxD motif
MNWNYLYLGKQLIIIVVLAVFAAVAACYSTPAYSPPAAPAPTPAPPPAPSAATQTYNVNIGTRAGLGNYLVDSRGMTLYYFTKDTNGKSSASAAIIQLWPVFSLSNISLAPPLNSADFGVITRDDGMHQVTFKGWPLYYYSKDQAPGDTMGQGYGNVWFIVSPDSLQPAPAAAPAPAYTPPAPQPAPPPSRTYSY